MATRAFDVKPLFAEPYFATDISDAITPEQIDLLKGLEMVDNQTNRISKDLYIFERKELRSIAKAVQNALDSYARDVMGIPQKFYVTQSWTLINPPGAGMHGHSHSNSIVSGSLYYAEMPEPPGNMVFERHSSYQQLELGPTNGQVNVYNTLKNVVVPQQGQLLLFPSRLQHYVEPNQTQQQRYSIAFNAFIKGKLGSLRDVSELTL
ncbi:TIGR02466 family protein [Pseudoblastomonas halimionae]|uniref:Fe2OG dioxygenase domain-containing protein n=1 Tax=Alteriqipengyuania halimionae TaxID=1926630 RepID=A0A6I4U4I0_9SPHN|nr:TIGR02466 family protein [Alteriqipengyuania halimionae]MXP09823.1 hypothetical protein [Alteriqipengyuania halimionae]